MKNEYGEDDLFEGADFSPVDPVQFVLAEAVLEDLVAVVRDVRELAEEAAAEAAQQGRSHAAAAARADSAQAEDQLRRSEVIAEMRRARGGW
jgi:hypothetical protein